MTDLKVMREMCELEEIPGGTAGDNILLLQYIARRINTLALLAVDKRMRGDEDDKDKPRGKWASKMMTTPMGCDMCKHEKVNLGKCVKCGEIIEGDRGDPLHN